MASQWRNFLHNLGEWHGSFTAISPAGAVLQDTPSILTLEPGEGEDPADIRLVLFRLRRFADANRQGPPSSDHRQEYRSLGRQVVFFDSGSFCKGSLQVAPGTVFGGEFGFLSGDRRHRLVVLFDVAGSFEQLVLIREVRSGSSAVERPPATSAELLGNWQGDSATVVADWPEAESNTVSLALDEQALSALLLLPDGGYCRIPEQVSHREAFSIEAGWLTSPGRLLRLIRRYDNTGAWQSASLETLNLI